MSRTRQGAALLTLAVVASLSCDDSPIETTRRVPIDELLSQPIAVAVNPSGIAPLTAEVEIRAVQDVSVVVEVLGEQPLEWVGMEEARESRIPVVGLYPDRKNRVALRVETGGPEFAVDTLEIETDALPDFFPVIEVLEATPAVMEPGWNLSSLSIGDDGVFRSYPIAFDADGNVRWYLDLSHFHDIVFMVEPLKNGNLIFGWDSWLYEIDRLGREVNRWSFPGYTFHHDVIEKPNGNFLVAVDKHGEATVEDHVIEIDRASGGIVREWDLRDVLDVSRRSLLGDDVDWFHMNSIWFDESDGGLILSGRHQGVVKVSEQNELLWILAPHEGWGPAGPSGEGPETSPFLLTAVDAAGAPLPDAVQLGEVAADGFDWPWAQHAAMLLPNGNLLLFDNGDHRRFQDAPPFFSRAVEYSIDTEEMTVREVWEYGRQRGADYYAPIISDVDLLPKTGNRLVMPGIVFGDEPSAFVTEVTYPEGEVVFDARIHFKNSLGTGSGEWGQFDIVYRSERMPLAPTPD